jgi:hypothetical protein
MTDDLDKEPRSEIGEDKWTWLGEDVAAPAPKQTRSGRGLKVAGFLVCCLLIAGIGTFAATSLGSSGDAQVRAPAATAKLPPPAAPTPMPTVHSGGGANMGGF